MSEPARRVVLITGVSSGIGRALTLECLRRGYEVSGCARRADRFEALASDAGAGRGRLHLAAADVRDAAATSAWIAGARDRFGGIDAIVHNAGYGVMGMVAELPVDDYRAQFETNFFAVVRLTRELLPELFRRGGGDIVLVSSILGHIGLPGRAPYCASKWALEGYAESIRPELRARGVRVSVVNPGFTDSEFADAVVVRGARPPGGVSRAMSAEAVGRAIAGCLGRQRRHVLLTGLGRLAMLARGLWPWGFERVTERSFRRELEAAAAAGGRPTATPGH